MVKEGYIAGVDNYWLEWVDGYDAKRLLVHLKAEFAAEFSNVGKWQDLLKVSLGDEVPEIIAFVAKRRTFQGTCDFYQSYS